jgi:hypothetical protein
MDHETGGRYTPAVKTYWHEVAENNKVKDVLAFPREHNNIFKLSGGTAYSKAVVRSAMASACETALRLPISPSI